MRKTLAGLALSLSAFGMHDSKFTVAQASIWEAARVAPLSIEALASQSEVYRNAEKKTFTQALEGHRESYVPFREWVEQGVPYGHFNAGHLATLAYGYDMRSLLGYLHGLDLHALAGYRDMERRIDHEFALLEKRAAAEQITPQEILTSQSEIIKAASFTFTRSKLRSSDRFLSSAGSWKEIQGRIEAGEGNCEINTGFFYTVVADQYERKNLSSLLERLHLATGLDAPHRNYLHVWALEPATDPVIGPATGFVIEMNHAKDDALYGANLGQAALVLRKEHPSAESYIPFVTLTGRKNSQHQTVMNPLVHILPKDIRAELAQKK